MQTPATPTSLVPTVERPEHKVAGHIRDAAEATGVSFEFLLAQANQESRLDPEARNRRSSAMGLFQFTAGTWLDMVKKHGAEHGLDKYADAIVRGGDGRLTVKDKEFKKEILDLRRDPRLSALMAGEYAKDNEQVLEAKLGRQVSTHDLYLAHFLGAGGALKLLKGRGQPEEGTPAELAGAAQANPEVFRDPTSGEHRTMTSVYAMVEKRFRRAMAEAAQVANALRPQVDLAALKPEGRPDEPAPDAVPALATATTPKPPDADPRPAITVAEPAPVAKNLPPRSDLAALRPEARPPHLDPARAVAEAGGGLPNTSDASLAVTMADIPATVSLFPARLPPRAIPASATQGAPGHQGGQPYPVALPPPVAGARADADTLRGLVAMLEDKD